MMPRPDTDILNILVLCTGNSARSILGECILNRLGAGRVQAFSAGSQPTGKVNPFAIDILHAKNCDTSGARSKSWDEFTGPDAPRIDLVITVCSNAANETCPVFPGPAVRAHWGIADPAAVRGSDEDKKLAFQLAHAALYARAEKLLELDLHAPDLQARVDAIGKSFPGHVAAN